MDCSEWSSMFSNATGKDYWHTRALTLPGTVGINLPQENLNSDVSRGYELVLKHANKDW